MALLQDVPRDPARRFVVFALAAGIPIACYLASASGHSYWLDSGEFVAAAVELGIAHPPGHPLQALVGRAVAFLPIGSLPFRIAVASSVLVAIASALLYRATETTVRAMRVVPQRVIVPISLGATWLVAGSYGWWIQAVRPEVYALAAALTMVVIERVVQLEASWPTRNLRPLYVAMAALGFALANHHFLAFLLFPAVAPSLARAQRACGVRPLFVAAAFVLPGLATYVYLPIRSAAYPALDLGHPTSWDRFVWLVSAKAFQKNTGDGVPQPLWERFADIAVQLATNLHPVALLLAAAGAYVLVRTAGARRIGYVWIAVVVTFVCARAWLGFVRANPDALGYLMPAFGALGALAAAFVAAVLSTIGNADVRTPRRTALLVAFVVSAFGLTQVYRTQGRASLAGFAATDAIDDIVRRELPPYAIVLVHSPQTVFRHWEIEAVEAQRPDVTLVPMPFLPYPSMIASLVDGTPELRDLLRGYSLEGELRQPALQSLAVLRPLLLEGDVRVPQGLYETLVPLGYHLQVLADGSTDADVAVGARTWTAAWRPVHARLEPELRDPETRNTLVWRHYVDALYFAGVGHFDSGRTAARLALALNPHARELRRLYALMEREEPHPIDIVPFLPQ